MAQRLGGVAHFALCLVEVLPAPRRWTGLTVWLPLLPLGFGILLHPSGQVTRFVGDFLLRQGSAEESIAPARIYPQALPLDVLLHYLIPHWVLKTFEVDPNWTNRIVGAIYGAILAFLAIAFARRLGTRGSALMAVAATIFFGGWLLLFTGYGKAFAEMSWILVTESPGFSAPAGWGASI